MPVDRRFRADQNGGQPAIRARALRRLWAAEDDEPLTWSDAALSLVIGSSCHGCARPGRVACAACQTVLLAGTPFRIGRLDGAVLVPVWAGGVYAGPLRSFVLAHKERRALGLKPVLAALLTAVITGALTSLVLPSGDGRGAEVPPKADCRPGRRSSPGESAARGARDGGLVLVPVPSRPGLARHRGHDPLLRLAQASRRRLASAGIPTGVAPVLRHRRAVRDQVGLDRRARSANLAGSFGVRAHPQLTAGPIVVVDDIVTSAATLNEAVRALTAVGRTPVACAVLGAATSGR